jgi:hypothetical protein
MRGFAFHRPMSLLALRAMLELPSLNPRTWNLEIHFDL